MFGVGVSVSVGPGQRPEEGQGIKFEAVANSVIFLYRKGDGSSG